MPSSPRSLTFGRILFRLRSLTPVPVIVLGAVLLARSRGAPGPGGAGVDAALDVLGMLVALAGQALRFYTLGQVPNGTSGQDNTLIARTLNTRGPYAHVRNPLYVGNLGICLGLMLIAHDPWVYALGLGFFFGEYHFIIRAEEAFLRERFGETYEDFLRKVPRWVPRLRPAYEGRLRDGFDVGRALRKEHNPFAAWSLGAVLLFAWERHARGELLSLRLHALEVLAATLVVLFVALKVYKRTWVPKTA